MPETPTDAAPAPPRRLDPRTILVRGLQGFPSAILGIPVFVAWSRGEGLPLGTLLAGMGLLLAALMLTGWLRWRTFTYQVLPGQLVIARGLFNRTRRSIPAERIQDVSIKQGPVSRLFGLAEVRVETGGGAADEGRLDSVSLTEAHRLREVLRGIRADARGVEANGPDPEVPGREAAEAVLFRMGLPRLLTFGVFNFSLVWIAAIFGLLQYFDQALSFDRARWLELAGRAERALQPWLNAPVFLAVAGAAIALGLMAGIVRTVLKYHGFTLTQGEGRFRYRRGLLTRTEVVVARRQIQLGLVERGAVSGRLGWCALKVQTLGGGDEASGRQDLAPFARAGEIAPILALAGLPPFERSGLRPVSPWHGLGGGVGFLLVPAVMIGLGAAVFPPAALGLLILPAPLAVALLRRRFHRHALAATSVQVTRGVLSRRAWTVPYGNVQAVTVRRGPLQRLLGIATVRIDTAGARGLHRPHVHDIDQADAQAFVGALMARAEDHGSETLSRSPQA